MDQHPQPNGAPPSAPAAESPSPSDARVAPKRRPKKALPTDRIAFPKQLELLHAHAIQSHDGERPATNVAVAEMVGMSHSTVSLANPFFTDVGLLVKSDGRARPSREVIEYSHARRWDDEHAAHKLAPLLAETWFGKEILRSLAFSGGMEDDAAIRQLAQEADAGTTYRPQLAMLLNYLQAAGLIERDGTRVRRAEPGVSPTSEPTQLRPTPDTQPSEPAVPSLPSVGVPAQPQPQGGVSFQVSVDVDMAEMASWEPARITAFFTGIAQVLAAKGAIEKTDAA
jgi:hypothetical protein